MALVHSCDSCHSWLNSPFFVPTKNELPVGSFLVWRVCLGLFRWIIVESRSRFASQFSRINQSCQQGAWSELGITQVAL